jgi:putative nucleotidyltransferase with HDIG domain
MRLLEFLVLFESLDPELRRNRKEMIKHFLTLNSYSKWNAEHSLEVARIARDFGKQIGVDVNKILKAALTHDVGKTKISKAILHKAGLYDPIERVEINKHAEAALDILKSLTGEHGKIAKQGAELHHTPSEEIDRLIDLKVLTYEEGELVKIIMICDIFEALTSKTRPYKEHTLKADAIEIMKTMPNIDQTLFKKFVEWQHQEFANEYRPEYIKREREKLKTAKFDS